MLHNKPEDWIMHESKDTHEENINGTRSELQNVKFDTGFSSQCGNFQCLNSLKKVLTTE